MYECFIEDCYTNYNTYSHLLETKVINNFLSEIHTLQRAEPPLQI